MTTCLDPMYLIPPATALAQPVTAAAAPKSLYCHQQPRHGFMACNKQSRTLQYLYSGSLF